MILLGFLVIMRIQIGAKMNGCVLLKRSQQMGSKSGQDA